uniref:alpha-1,2-Mannosidase n=1 Tax=Strigamia maritima TaxID=126957 RepID=T1JM49_STRMM
MSRRDYVSLAVSQFADDNQKVKRIKLWRWWKQKSRFERSFLLLLAALSLLFIIFVIPDWYKLQSLHNLEELKIEPVDIQNPLVENEVFVENEQIPDPNAKLFPENVQPQPQIAEPDKSERKPEPERIKVYFSGPTNERQSAVVSAFKYAWAAYKEHAWGHDHLKPISKTYSDWFGLGLTIVDSVDTILIMGLKEEYDDARQYISEVLNFDKNKDVNCFEVTIRVLGGLLGTYHLTNDELFKNKAVDLADRLLPCFSSKSGIPYSDVNLRSHRSHPPRWGPDSSVSEVSTIQIEFKDLSRLTGDPKYEAAADKVSQHLHEQPKQDGLVPIFINAETGRFRPYTTITLGARADSYYEYLLKQWVQTGKTKDFLLKDYNASINGMINNLLRYSEPNKLAFMGELINGKNFKPKMDHLACYLPAILILGYHHGLPLKHFHLAQELIYTCYQMYVRMPTKLAPEIVHFNLNPTVGEDLIVKVADTHNLLRPETIESLWYMYHFTKNKTYQEWGWEIFQAFEKHTKIIDGGYSSISNVKNPDDTQSKDMMESFFLGETLKYFYLLFSKDQKTLSLDKWVFNTEAHPLKIWTS